jgi:hypothetical protein
MDGRHHKKTPAGFAPYVCRVYHCEPAIAQALPSDEIHEVECVSRNFLVIFIIRHERPANIGRNDFGTEKMFLCKCGFATAGGPNENDQRRVRDQKLNGITFDC